MLFRSVYCGILVTFDAFDAVYPSTHTGCGFGEVRGVDGISKAGLSMYVCMFSREYSCFLVCMCVCVCIYLYIFVRARVCVGCVCVCVYSCVRTYVCMYVCMYVCVRGFV